MSGDIPSWMNKVEPGEDKWKGRKDADEYEAFVTDNGRPAMGVILHRRGGNDDDAFSYHDIRGLHRICRNGRDYITFSEGGRLVVLGGLQLERLLVELNGSLVTHMYEYNIDKYGETPPEGALIDRVAVTWIKERPDPVRLLDAAEQSGGM